MVGELVRSFSPRLPWLFDPVPVAAFPHYFLIDRHRPLASLSAKDDEDAGGLAIAIPHDSPPAFLRNQEI
jgi:hypothetical protein